MKGSTVGELVTCAGLIAVAALGLSGCGGTEASPDGAAGGGGAGGSGGDAAACDCRLDPDGTLVLPWACYCPAGGCEAWVSCGTGATRVDYPECGLIVVRAAEAFGWIVSVFDSTSGALVGRTAHGDSAATVCPTNPALSSYTVHYGQAPAASCRAVTCAVCMPAGGFPCSPA